MVNVGNNRNVAQVHVAPKLSLLCGVAGPIAWELRKGKSPLSVAIGHKSVKCSEKLGPHFVIFQHDLVEGLGDDNH